MNIIGVELKLPSTKELTLIACIFVFQALLFIVVFPYFEVLPTEGTQPLLLGAFTGILLNAFGIKISKGWNHRLLMLVAIVIIYLIIPNLTT